MNNVLECNFHGLEWNGYKVVPLRVDELWASVPRADKHRGKDFYKRVEEDVAKNGLHFPLLVVDAKRGDLVKQKKRYTNKICELPFDPKLDDLNVRQYTVWGGSNRWHVAKNLGYEYVDCVIIPNADFDKSRRMQALHRAPYKKQFY